jgi:hypothetical protein
VNLILVKNVLFKEEAQALGLLLGEQKGQGRLGKLDGINKASRHTAVTM